MTRPCCVCREPFRPRHHRVYRCDACMRAYQRDWYWAHIHYARAVSRAKYRPHGEPNPWRSQRAAA